jgi:diketogulonate reductase-like aldo/keto reductase
VVTEQPYLVVQVRMPMNEIMASPYPQQEAILAWLSRHGIDVTKEFSWFDEIDSFCRVFMQTHMKEPLHVTHATTPSEPEP